MICPQTSRTAEPNLLHLCHNLNRLLSKLGQDLRQTLSDTPPPPEPLSRIAHPREKTAMKMWAMNDIQSNPAFASVDILGAKTTIGDVHAIVTHGMPSRMYSTFM